MAHRSSSSSSSSETDCRIVLFGKVGAGRNKVTRTLLGGKEAKGESGLCVIRSGNVVGRRVCVVETPGWDRVSLVRTTEKIKNEITRSVTLCPPGPHALLLVVPVSLGDPPPAKELKTAVQHMELNSARVWNHTMVLFLCDQDVDQSTVNKHVENAEKLLEKCGGRYYVLRSSEDSETQIHELLKKIDDMVEENCGDCFLPQVYYEIIERKSTQDINDLRKLYEDREKRLKKEYQRRLNQCKKQAEEQETAGRRRRVSFDLPRPDLNEDQPPDIDAIKRKYRDDLLALARHYFKPAAVVVMAFIGALVGSVVGSTFGVMGSGLGIFIGAVVTFPLTLWLIDAARLARDGSVALRERKHVT